MSKQRSNRPVSTLGFVMLVLAIVGVGLGGVMVTTTAIGAQSRELSRLQTEASALEYESASLRSQLETLSSTGSLALRAADLGMVPNPYPAYVMLGSGEVLGEPKAVSGKEFPQLRGRAPEPEPSPTPIVTPSPVPAEPTEEGDARPESPEDAVAAGDGEQQAQPAPTEEGQAEAPAPSATPETTDEGE